MKLLTKEQLMEQCYKEFLKAKRESERAITKMDTYMKMMYAYA